MRSILALGNIQTVSDPLATMAQDCTCHQAQKRCMPSFVFSVAGQVGFRTALDHLINCTSRDCASLRKKVKDGMYDKLRWLFQEEVLLGCIHVQPFLYRSRSVNDIRKQRHFVTIASHLSQCPHESCARLRRSVLLKVRDNVSPNAK